MLLAFFDLVVSCFQREKLENHEKRWEEATPSASSTDSNRDSAIVCVLSLFFSHRPEPHDEAHRYAHVSPTLFHCQHSLLTTRVEVDAHQVEESRD
jgi:hypothetical protein